MQPPEVFGSIAVPGYSLFAQVFVRTTWLASRGFTLRTPETVLATLTGFGPIRPTEGILLEPSTLTATPSGHLAQLVPTLSQRTLIIPTFFSIFRQFRIWEETHMKIFPMVRLF